MNCPKCDSIRYYFVRRVYEYHTISSIDTDGNVIPSDLDAINIDPDFPTYLYCSSCDTVFNANQDEIEPPEVFDVPISIEVKGEMS